MSRVMELIRNDPTVALLAGGALVLSAVAGVLGGVIGFAGVLAASAAACGVFACVRVMRSRVRSTRSGPFAQGLFDNLSTPGLQQTPSVGESASVTRARVDDLRGRFSEGVQTLRDHGQDLYAMPWYLVVGEPGAGKTEAIRHSSIGFPPGLQDQLQGAGGTLNMNWWFSREAVILDTAGRMLLEDSGAEEWKGFLGLLKRHRPACPVNGAVLVIPADSLLTDDPNETAQKAARIAGQIEELQSSLDVRFPVWVVVSKSDLITGFREFFEGVNDPRAIHQMLGWSNAAGLEDPFHPSELDRLLAPMFERVRRRRAGLALDAAVGANATDHPLDRIDALAAFPDALANIVPPLRTYLEQIFASGAWSRSPLYLRGIYFNSAMRDGDAIDQELARAVGLTPEALPGGRAWERDRSYFLGDVFKEKIFRERGLVTQASNALSTRRRQRAVSIGAALVAVLTLIGLTVAGHLTLRDRLERPSELWAHLAVIADEPEAYEIVQREQGATIYQGDAVVGPPDLPVTVARLPGFLADRLANDRLGLPSVFSPIAAVLGDPRTRSADAARGLVRALVIDPVVRSAAESVIEAELYVPELTYAVQELLRADAGETPTRLDGLMSLAIPGVQIDPATLAELERGLNDLYGESEQRVSASVPLERVLGAYALLSAEESIGPAGPVAKLQAVDGALRRWDETERAFWTALSEEPVPTAALWREHLTKLEGAGSDLAEASEGATVSRASMESLAGLAADRAASRLTSLLESASDEQTIAIERARTSARDRATAGAEELIERLLSSSEPLDESPDAFRAVYASRLAWYREISAKIEQSASPQPGRLAESFDRSSLDALASKHTGQPGGYEIASRVLSDALARYAGARTERAVERVLESRPYTQTVLRARVADLASSMAPIDREPIPLTRLRPHPRDYHPEAAALLLADWAALGETIERAYARDPAIWSAHRQSYEQTDRAVYEPYRESIGRYWATDALAGLEPDCSPLTGWGDTRAELEELDVSEVTRALELEIRRAAEAIERLGLEELQHTDLSAFEDRDLFNDLEDSITHWAELDSDATIARGSLLSTSASRFQRLYLVPFDPGLGPARVYWGKIARHAFERIVADARRASTDAVIELAGLDAPFPLAIDGEISIPIARLRDVAQLCELAFLDQDAPAEGTVATRSLSDPWVESRLEQLRTAGNQPDRWAKALLRVLEVLPVDEPGSLSIEAPAAGSSQRAPTTTLARRAEPALPASLTYLTIRDDQGSSRELALDAPGDSGGRYPWPSERTLTLELSQGPGQRMIASTMLEAPWGLLAEVLREGVTPDADDPRRFRVPLVFRTPDRARAYYAWVDIRLDRDLPPRESWPVRAVWPEPEDFVRRPGG